MVEQIQQRSRPYTTLSSQDAGYHAARPIPIQPRTQTTVGKRREPGRVGSTSTSSSAIHDLSKKVISVSRMASNSRVITPETTYMMPAFRDYGGAFLSREDNSRERASPSVSQA